jgi:hypothetical protein
VNEAEISQYINATFEGVDVVTDSGASFFFYNPDSDVPPDHKFPFVTLVTGDDVYDQFSRLDRSGVFRLNIGISKQTFRTLFGEPKLPSGSTAESDPNDSDYDFTVQDKVMPHPVYGRMYWVCILNPGDKTFATDVQPLLAEAYEQAVGKYNRKGSRAG